MQLIWTVHNDLDLKIGQELYNGAKVEACQAL